MRVEQTAFGTVEVITEADDEGTEVTIRALTPDYTEADWNAAADHASALRRGLPPVESVRTSELSFHAWHPLAKPLG